MIGIKLVFLLNLIILTPKKSSGQISPHPPPHTICKYLPSDKIRVKCCLVTILLLSGRSQAGDKTAFLTTNR